MICEFLYEKVKKKCRKYIKIKKEKRRKMQKRKGENKS
jgi:hypothetical protein